jgi:uncharacterized protein YqfA (UPF0365 family)
MKGHTKRCRFVEKEEEVPVVVKEEAERGWMDIKYTNMVEVQGEMEMYTNVLEEPIHEVVIGKGLVGVLNLILQERRILKEKVD